MEIGELDARPREVHGSRACRRLRRDDLVPAVIYGRSEPNVLLAVSRKDVEHLVGEHVSVVQVNWDGRQENTQIKEIQYDALGDRILHLDLVRISLTETVTVSVSIKTHGEPTGVAEGGTLNVIQYELEIECLPAAIPENVRVEVSHLGIGDSLRVADIELPEGVTPLDDPDTVVVTIVPPQELPEEEEEPLAAELAAEPEVIGREPGREAPGEEGESA